ncbi:MAG TPA: enoyl-CoA hydratase-related protein [Bacillota bacterium]|nr:enoyl-CoA hydratase-related protein [Bacillota bacterium]
MTVADPVLYEVADGVATITLNRPEVLNSLDEPTGRALIAALRRTAGDRGARAVVLTGAGRGFCAGQDLKEPQSSLGDAIRNRYNPIVRAIRACPQPVIAAVNGVAAGAGCAFALACDLRIASAQASFVLAFAKIGLVPDSGASFFLPRLVGFGKAMELALLGGRLDAEEALRLGMVTRVVPAEELQSATLALATELAAGPYGLALIKRAMLHGAAVDLDAALEQEAYLQDLAGRSADHREARAAFTEKRPPKFTRS